MKSSKGFTIIELIVVIAVFMFVISAVVAIFISIVQQQRRVLSEQQLLNQVSYVEEYMSKAMRMAKTVSNNSCVPTGFIYLLTDYDQSLQAFRGIQFFNQSDEICQKFVWDKTSGILQEIKNNSPAVALTSADLRINSIKFSINGSDGSTLGCSNPPNQCGASAADLIQPRVTMLMNIRIASDNGSPVRTIQTTVSQRNLNVK